MKQRCDDCDGKRKRFFRSCLVRLWSLRDEFQVCSKGLSIDEVLLPMRCQKVYFLGVHEDELHYKISLRSLIQMCMSMRRNPRPKAKRWPLIFSSRTFQSLLKKGFWARKDPCESFPRFPFDLALNKKTNASVTYGEKSSWYFNGTT